MIGKIRSKRKNKPVISLGNLYNLHSGYHGAFVNYPNEYFTFKPAAPRIVCYQLDDQGGAFHPTKQPFYFEVHKYPAKAKFIQSASYPVSNKVP